MVTSPLASETHSLLSREFYQRDPRVVARELIGKQLCSRVNRILAGGLIVETEAYLAENDPACHGSIGPKSKNRSMFGPAGFAYVYSIHAKHCFNVVTQAPGIASAVLIRAISPTIGLQQMSRRRMQHPTLASGPARLCQALAIDLSLNGWDLTQRRRVWIEHAEMPDTPSVKVTRRIGVTSAKNLKLRFVWAGHPHASGPLYLR